MSVSLGRLGWQRGPDTSRSRGDETRDPRAGRRQTTAFLPCSTQWLTYRERRRRGSEPTRIFSYFGALIFLIALASPVGYLGDISTSYMLKDRLHATASEVSSFRIYSAIPVYLSFLFGFIRDRWSPFGLRDRGYLLIFGPVTAVAYAWLAWQKLTSRD